MTTHKSVLSIINRSGKKMAKLVQILQKSTSATPFPTLVKNKLIITNKLADIFKVATTEEEYLFPKLAPKVTTTPKQNTSVVPTITTTTTQYPGVEPTMHITPKQSTIVAHTLSTTFKQTLRLTNIVIPENAPSRHSDTQRKTKKI